MRYLLGILALLMVLSGCTVSKILVPTGGSRADGTVELSYELGPYEKAEVDMVKAQQQAKSRCASWGYENAEMFGGQKKTCNMPSMGGCNQWLVTVQYQCLGDVN